MASTVKDIKASMEVAFMQSAIFSGLYGFDQGDDFNATFSTVSFESILLYIIAFFANIIEKLFDSHKSEVATTISEDKPHTPNWYKNKALAYQHGYTVVDNEDYYDNTGLTSAQIEAAKVVKYAAVVEKANVVYIKVAAAGLVQLTDDQVAGLHTYFKDNVKDCGVKLSIINRPADYFKAEFIIYYNPIVLNSQGINAITGDESARTTVKAFIASLPFNGEYRNTALVDKLQELAGVVMPELVSSQTSKDGSSFTDIDAYCVPDSGYMKLYDESHLTITYKVYETVGD